ncbi:hypothetical protein [Desulfurococcus mucosus]|uniref:Uncharacterized protein n=1 Tax=Desulfurococcus mucosus (strain ATCC 35584 / DSM 2162 / JCM 9187 / O7/1) TaxID=765177 RepID=E8R9Y8_DESM0|nr:hypothetical protein [Desulfurococcus mucosus]ADV65314.1 hypothetical protein Desmu_1012 [Desulfurococcus mucosus DSM 2162]
MDAYVFTILLLSQTVLAGLTVYLVFYVLFQRLVADKIPAQRDEVSELPVMGGFIVEKPESPSITRVAVDILRRAWRSSVVLERGVASYLSDWYFISVVFLIALILILLAAGW